MRLWVFLKILSSRQWSNRFRWKKLTSEQAFFLSTPDIFILIFIDFWKNNTVILYYKSPREIILSFFVLARFQNTEPIGSFVAGKLSSWLVFQHKSSLLYTHYFHMTFASGHGAPWDFVPKMDKKKQDNEGLMSVECRACHSDECWQFVAHKPYCTLQKPSAKEVIW